MLICVLLVRYRYTQILYIQSGWVRPSKLPRVLRFRTLKCTNSNIYNSIFSQVDHSLAFNKWDSKSTLRFSFAIDGGYWLRLSYMLITIVLPHINIQLFNQSSSIKSSTLIMAVITESVNWYRLISNVITNINFMSKRIPNLYKKVTNCNQRQFTNKKKAGTFSSKYCNMTEQHQHINKHYNKLHFYYSCYFFVRIS